MDKAKLVSDSDQEEYGSTSIRQPQGSPGLQPKGHDLNGVYENYVGFGRAQVAYWITVGLVAYSDYAELTLLSVILPTLRCEWDLTQTFEAGITFAVYGSYALLSIIFGKVADRVGRKPVLMCATVLLIVSAVAGALSPNKWVFLATRVATGGCVGINLSCIVCYCTEFSESKYRAQGILVFQFSADLGILIVSLIAFLVQDVLGWRALIIITSLAAIPALILISILPESPRYLIASGQHEKAVKAIRYIAKMNGRELPGNVEIECPDDKDRGSYRMLFADTHRRSTLSLSLMYFSCIFIAYGLIVWIPLILNADTCGGTADAGSESDQCKGLDSESLLELTMVGLAAVIANIVSLFVIMKVGRLIPIRTASVILPIVTSLLLICINKTATFWLVTTVKVVTKMVNFIIWVMVPESFPTNIRSTATGFINSSGKIGGVFGTGIVYLFFYTDPNIVVGLFIGAAVLNLMGTFIFNKETKDVILQET